MEDLLFPKEEYPSICEKSFERYRRTFAQDITFTQDMLASCCLNSDGVYTVLDKQEVCKDDEEEGFWCDVKLGIIAVKKLSISVIAACTCCP